MSREFMENLIIEQQKTIESMRQETSILIAENQKLTLAVSNLSEQVEYLTHKLFGTSSEKTKQFEGQMSLFEEESTVNEVELLADELVVEEKVTKPRKAKTTRAEQFKNLPITEVVIDLTDDEKFCDYCNTPLEFLGTEVVREEIKYIPAKLEVIRTIRNTYSCPTCKEDDVPCFKKPEVGSALIPHSFASASIVSSVIYQKYVNAMPLYRQEKDYRALDAPISRATLAKWVNTCGITYFGVLYEHMHQELMTREVLMSDETPCQVLKEPGREATTRSFMWIHRTGNDGLHPIIMYDYQQSRSGDHAVDFLGEFKGYHHCDGFSGYNKLKDAIRVGCFAHVRRKFRDAIPKKHPKSAGYLPGHYGVAFCDKLFKLEEGLKDLSPEERKEQRLIQEKPVLDAFFVWLKKQDPPKGSRLYKAVQYALNQWEYLNNYLLDGRCSISNNLTENSVRPYTLIRKNSLFHDTPSGATASAIICSIIETAKANNLNVQKYLEHILLVMPDRIESAGVEELMPWSEVIQEKFKNK